MPEKKKKNKKDIKEETKVRLSDLKPRKDAKGGAFNRPGGSKINMPTPPTP
jgi:hypothetical protein